MPVKGDSCECGGVFVEYNIWEEDSVVDGEFPVSVVMVRYQAPILRRVL